MPVITPRSKILITGATGYLGKLLARELYRQGHHVVLPIRASTDESFAQRAAALSGDLGATSSGHCEILSVHIDNPEDLNELPRDIDVIVHCAAVTRFNVEEDTANRANRDSSRSIFEYARRCKNLRSLNYVSTVYAAGDQQGPIQETRLDGNRNFANHYERSKWETENILFNDFSDLPWNILRVATVLCDNESGVTGQLNAVHNTLKLFYYGLISLIPGKENTPVYLVTGEFVTTAIVSVLASNATHEIVHITHQRQESLTLRELIDVAFATFLEDEKFKTRGTQKPLFVDEESFQLVADGVKGFGGSVLVEAMGSVAPFAKQLFISKDFANERLRHFYPTAKAPEPKELLTNLIHSLIASRWGRNRENS